MRAGQSCHDALKIETPSHSQNHLGRRTEMAQRSLERLRESAEPFPKWHSWKKCRWNVQRKDRWTESSRPAVLVALPALIH
jgi:hypothetical protein